MRIVFLGVLFIACCLAISKAIASFVPVFAFYAVANALGIHGDEAVIDFLLIANLSLSVILSAILVAIVTSLRHN